MSEKSTIYNPKNIEDSYYKIWEERGYFEIDGNKEIQEKDKNFCIMIGMAVSCYISKCYRVISGSFYFSAWKYPVA